jgi:hypothetical protein
MQLNNALFKRQNDLVKFRDFVGRRKRSVFLNCLFSRQTETEAYRLLINNNNNNSHTSQISDHMSPLIILTVDLFTVSCSDIVPSSSSLPKAKHNAESLKEIKYVKAVFFQMCLRKTLKRSHPVQQNPCRTT